MRYILILYFVIAWNYCAVSQDSLNTSPEIKPGWWFIPKTKIQVKVGGYIKLDVIHDFKPIGSPDYFDVSTIPTDGSEGGNTNLHIKETRLFTDIRLPSKIGKIRGYIEGDFYGSGSAFRIRHAFVELGEHWRFGQFWSNFMDETIIPPTLDFEKPAAYAFARHPMVRWKNSIGSKSYIAISIEKPGINAQTPEEPGSFKSPMPDITARYRLSDKWGHVQFSAFIALLKYYYETGGSDGVTIAGVNLSGQINTYRKDKLLLQVIAGPGVNRYRGGQFAALDENGFLEALRGIGATAAYQRVWSEKFSSLIVFNHGTDKETDGQPVTDMNTGSYFALNTIWNITESVFTGVEYLHGLRKDIDGSSGTADRLQFSVRYTFNN